MGAGQEGAAVSVSGERRRSRRKHRGGFRQYHGEYHELPQL